MEKKSNFRMRRIALILVAGAFAGLLAGCGGNKEAPASAPTVKEAVTNEGEKSEFKFENLPDLLLNGEYETIYNHTNQAFKDEISLADFSALVGDFSKDVDSLQQSSILKLNGMDLRSWTTPGGNKGLIALVDASNEINSLQVRSLDVYPETDAQFTNTAFEPPFKGDWYVYWGGINALVNYHYEYPGQRYAYDIIKVKDEKSYKGDPLKNESYYAFNQDAFAPADGIVVKVVNDIPDNEPVGVMNEKAPEGNVVVIDHGGEYSFIAHMKKGTIVVKEGDKVETGDLLGKTGNSGNSSEAHLHFQVSNGPDLFDGTHAIRVQWKNKIDDSQGHTISSD
ncbi:M23 family metallopeptidase [Paenibacillus radicis (ex Gao et al. 2016)]|uniref:Peptidase M23 n=1 Tax=Paenibacillus radicis (ex Gao et al. 2016) TaxID=1737354 RepID=A0A917HJE3_9BACL|nr:M23 family metallopeptidase [Paenibacillus radicis (ex Gao et al. 2016)]GGG81480.1 peptidase M23 [Paenibacillus radicis (ex Gao et al. 2016)]